jgi:hypothetical protein
VNFMTKFTSGGVSRVAYYSAVLKKRKLLILMLPKRPTMAPLPPLGYILGTVTCFAPDALQIRRTAVVVTSEFPTIRNFDGSINPCPFLDSYYFDCSAMYVISVPTHACTVQLCFGKQLLASTRFEKSMI